MNVYFTVTDLSFNSTSNPTYVCGATFSYYLDKSKTQFIGSSQYGETHTTEGSKSYPVRTGLRINFVSASNLITYQALSSQATFAPGAQPTGWNSATLTLVGALVNGSGALLPAVTPTGGLPLVNIPSPVQQVISTVFVMTVTPSTTSGSSTPLVFFSPDPVSENEGR